MTDAERMSWIDSASLTELLEKWRFAEVGNPFFQGAVGEHYTATFAKRRQEAGPAAYTAASRQVGWNSR